MWGGKRLVLLPSCDKAFFINCQLIGIELLSWWYSSTMAALLTVSLAFFLVIVINRFNYCLSFSPFWVFMVGWKKFRKLYLEKLSCRLSVLPMFRYRWSSGPVDVIQVVNIHWLGSRKTDLSFLFWCVTWMKDF